MPIAKNIEKTALLSCLSIIVFFGAFLLFEIEPLTGKIITPLLGGTSQTWIVCLLFFQIVVLGGYLLTFLLSGLPKQKQIMVYILLFALSLWWSRLSTVSTWIDSYTSDPTLTLLSTLTAHLSIPCIVLSSISGTMQVWQTIAGDQNPYKLYSLSNLGSFGALLIYPTLIEPRLTVTATLRIWELSYCIIFVCAIIAATLVWRQLASPGSNIINAETTVSQPIQNEKIAAKQIRHWLYLSTLGSAGLLAFSSYITSDVSPVPLLWVLPLAIYLMTFVIAFAHPKMKTGLLVATWIPMVIAELVCSNISPVAVLIVNLILLFQLCMVTNVELAASKPPPEQLPAFYLVMAIGGALGGILVAVVAPLCFNFVAERSLIILAFTISQLFAGTAGLSRKRLFVRIVIAILMTIAILTLLILPAPGVVDRERNFFGSVTVRRDGEMLTLQHGNVIHGRQYLDPSKQAIDVYPYGPPAALIFAYLHEARAPKPLSIGVIGLGAGSMAVEASTGDDITFYEIDPKVDKIAKTWFSYLAHSKPDVSVQVGDGRLLLRDSKKSFDGICIDAFGGDAVPVHLLTVEAMQIYLQHLKPDGVVFFHVTNAYLDLTPTLGNLAKSLHCQACQLDYAKGVKYIVLAPKAEIMQELVAFAKNNGAKFSDTTVRDVPTRPQWSVWTDNYSDLFDVLKWHQ